MHGETGSRPYNRGAANPIYQTTSYVFKDSDHAANSFGLREVGNNTTPDHEPDQRCPGKAHRHGPPGSGALAFPNWAGSGNLALMQLRGPEMKLSPLTISTAGPMELFHHTFPKLGRKVRFVNSTDPASFKDAITERTLAVYPKTYRQSQAPYGRLRGNLKDKPMTARVPFRCSQYCGNNIVWSVRFWRRH